MLQIQYELIEPNWKIKSLSAENLQDGEYLFIGKTALLGITMWGVFSTKRSVSCAVEHSKYPFTSRRDAQKALYKELIKRGIIKLNGEYYERKRQ